MLRLQRLLHDFEVQPIEAFRDDRFDFVLQIQVWQIFCFSSAILSAATDADGNDVLV